MTVMKFYWILYDIPAIFCRDTQDSLWTHAHLHPSNREALAVLTFLLESLVAEGSNFVDYDIGVWCDEKNSASKPCVRGNENKLLHWRKKIPGKFSFVIRKSSLPKDTLPDFSSQQPVVYVIFRAKGGKYTILRDGLVVLYKTRNIKIDTWLSGLLVYENAFYGILCYISLSNK